MINLHYYAIPGMKFREDVPFYQCRLDMKPQLIVDSVCEFYRIPLELLAKGVKRGTTAVVIPRHVAMYLLCTETSLSLKDIGKLLGGFDHTSIIAGRRCLERRMKYNDSLKAQIKLILNNVR
jgi:chromosomal replication initiator protein